MCTFVHRYLGFVTKTKVTKKGRIPSEEADLNFRDVKKFYRTQIEYFKDKNTILVYFSDHGEEVYDYRNQCARDHGKLTADKLKYQYDIPFWVWCSDAFNDCYPNKVEDIKAATKRPMIIDNVCHMLFNAGGIECRHYREKLDVISDKYQNRKRAINRKYFYEDIRYPRKP